MNGRIPTILSSLPPSRPPSVSLVRSLWLPSTVDSVSPGFWYLAAILVLIVLCFSWLSLVSLYAPWVLSLVLLSPDYLLPLSSQLVWSLWFVTVSLLWLSRISGAFWNGIPGVLSSRLSGPWSLRLSLSACLLGCLSNVSDFVCSGCSFNLSALVLGLTWCPLGTPWQPLWLAGILAFDFLVCSPTLLVLLSGRLRTAHSGLGSYLRSSLSGNALCSLVLAVYLRHRSSSGRGSSDVWWGTASRTPVEEAGLEPVLLRLIARMIV
ncbi:hypothetical protein NLI96_g4065 [Meripilus lineatus]|uniref:Transmembrane protein n=1 Tax=Meripilus lineatus TaxID=2056292 RepID=A0AAD5V5J5_9APHY|nr:hypothetical protein NLI96_g4065 [Physisporinus lineatus]